MATGEFEKSNLGWQIQQLQQKIGQWWEWQLKQFNPDLPNIDLNSPAWGWLEFLWFMIRGIMIIVLVLLIMWAIWRIWKLIRPYLYELQEQNFEKYQPSIHREFSIDELLKKSQQFQTQGDYYQACRYIYLAMLQQLQEQGVIPQQISRTDGEYLDLILQLPRPDPYETLLHIHEQLCFGSQTASASLLATCQNAYQDIIDN
jgi:hypothetical protein